MSHDHRPPQYGPGKTVVMDQVGPDGGPRAGAAALPPTTIHEPVGAPPAYDAPPAPYVPPPGYGAYAPGPSFTPHPPPPAFPVVPPYALPLPPRAREKPRRGVPLWVIGIVSAGVIGTAATLVAIRLQPASDDKSDPAIDLPAPATVKQDPPAAPEPPPDMPPSIIPPPIRTRPSLSSVVPPRAPPTSPPGRPAGPGLSPRPQPPRRGPQGPPGPPPDDDDSPRWPSRQPW